MLLSVKMPPLCIASFHDLRRYRLRCRFFEIFFRRRHDAFITFSAAYDSRGRQMVMRRFVIISYFDYCAMPLATLFAATAFITAMMPHTLRHAMLYFRH